MPAGGYLTWNATVLSFLDLNGYVIRDCVVNMSVAWGPSGIQVPMLSGGWVYQRIPQGLHAPLDLGPRAFAFNFQMANEEDYHRVKRITSIAKNQPVYLFPEYQMEDVWPLRGDVNLTWVLSRQTAFGIHPFATYTPEAFIQAPDGTQVATAVVVDMVNNSTTITSVDLSASAGSFLVFRYHPLFLATIDSISEAIPEPNGLDFTVNMTEHVPVRSYG